MNSVIGCVAQVIIFYDEFGTTTGRSRRCGWLDTVVLRYSVAVNGFTDLAITKLDILSGFDELKIAVAYEIDGERVDFLPSTLSDLALATPVYETLPGWHEDIMSARTPEDLPEKCTKLYPAYIRTVRNSDYNGKRRA